MVQVLDFELQRQLVPHMKEMTPLPGIYDPDFIAANQDARADNLIKGSKKEQVCTYGYSNKRLHVHLGTLTRSVLSPMTFLAEKSICCSHSIQGCKVICKHPINGTFNVSNTLFHLMT